MSDTPREKHNNTLTDEQLGRYAIKALNRIIQQGCNPKPEDTDKDAAQFVLDQITALRGAATALLDRYVALVNSGDAGNWNPEDEPEVIALRRALDIPKPK